MGFRVSKNSGYHFGGPYNKDYTIWGSILGYSNIGELPHIGLYILKLTV